MYINYDIIFIDERVGHHADKGVCMKKELTWQNLKTELTERGDKATCFRDLYFCDGPSEKLVSICVDINYIADSSIRSADYLSMVGEITTDYMIHLILKNCSYFRKYDSIESCAHECLHDLYFLDYFKADFIESLDWAVFENHNKPVQFESDLPLSKKEFILESQGKFENDAENLWVYVDGVQANIEFYRPEEKPFENSKLFDEMPLEKALKDESFESLYKSYLEEKRYE